jgi:hypothetical protein
MLLRIFLTPDAVLPKLPPQELAIGGEMLLLMRFKVGKGGKE